MGNQRAGERGRRCEERRRPADHRGPTAAERGFSSQQTAKPNPEGSGCGSTNILRDEELRDIVAAGETGERETNAPNQFQAPRAVEERETNVTCQGKKPRTQGHGKSTCRLIRGVGL